MGSPLASRVWASESPIACPCCAVVEATKLSRDKRRLG